MVFDKYDDLEQDILKAMYLQLLLQITIRDLRNSHKAYVHFAKKNRQFMRKIEKGMRIANANAGFSMKELVKDMDLFVSNSTFTLFKDESDIASVMLKKTDELINKYKGTLSFDFRGLKESGKTMLLIPDDWECSHKFLNFYTPENETKLEQILLNSEPEYNFEKNLNKAERFIERQTRIKLVADEQLKALFGGEKELNKMTIGGILSPRNPLSYTSQQQYFMFNRMCAVVAYRDMLKEQCNYMVGRYRKQAENQFAGQTEDFIFGSVNSALKFADELITEYHNFYDEPVDDNSLFDGEKWAYKDAFDSWYDVQMCYEDSQSANMVYNMYVNNCDNYSSINDIKNQLQHVEYHFA